MASRKPLVLVSGEVQELTSSDTLDAAVSEVDIIARTAAATLIAGQPVYASSGTEVNKADADADATSKCIGLAKAAINSAASGSIQTNGLITLTTGEWDAVCGTSGGLAVGTIYYLSGGTAGLLTSTAPTTTGHYVVPVIKGISTTEALIVVDYTSVSSGDNGNGKGHRI